MTGLVRLCPRCSRQADGHQSLSLRAPHLTALTSANTGVAEATGILLNTRRNCLSQHPSQMTLGFLDASPLSPRQTSSAQRLHEAARRVRPEEHHTYLEKLNLVKWTVFFIKRVKFSASARRGFLENNHQRIKILPSSQGMSPLPSLCSTFHNHRTLATMDRCKKCSCMKFSDR